MRRAIISDIHGNFAGLEAIARHAADRGITVFDCLGDIIGYGPYPRECLDWVRENCDRILQGNHEAAIVEKIKGIKKDGDISIRTALRGTGAFEGGLWTIHQMYGFEYPIEDEDTASRLVRAACGSKPDLKSDKRFKGIDADMGEDYFGFMDSLPTSATVDTPLGKILYVHDDPFDPAMAYTYIIDELNPHTNRYNGRLVSRIFEQWNFKDTFAICAGHMHYASVCRSVDDEGVRYVCVTGGAMPKRGERVVRYLEFDSDSIAPFVVHSLDMDFAKLDADMIDRGIPKVYKA